MTTKQLIHKVELLLILFITACTRSASTQGIPGFPALVSPTASQAVSSASALQVSSEPEPVLPTNTPIELSVPSTTETSQSQEIAVIHLPLDGPIADPLAEISGMAWYADDLLLLPQYPDRFGDDGNGYIFGLNKKDILSYIQGATGNPLTPYLIPLITNNLEAMLNGFEGFEAIAIEGDQIYLTVETKPAGMMGYLVSGKISPDLSHIILDTSRLISITPQTELTNYSDEALLVFGNRLFSIYEVNGAALNPTPLAHQFDFSLQVLDPLAFPNIEYRITDATSVNEFGRFWGINYFFPGESALKPDADPLERQYGEGPSHSRFETVERLVEFQFSYTGIILSDTPPIQLELIDDNHSRNWEAIARLEGFGFLLSTDKFPETILGYIPYP